MPVVAISCGFKSHLLHYFFVFFNQPYHNYKKGRHDLSEFEINHAFPFIFFFISKAISRMHCLCLFYPLLHLTHNIVIYLHAGLSVIVRSISSLIPLRCQPGIQVYKISSCNLRFHFFIKCFDCLIVRIFIRYFYRSLLPGYVPELLFASTGESSH